MRRLDYSKQRGKTIVQCLKSGDIWEMEESGDGLLLKLNNEFNFISLAKETIKPCMVTLSYQHKLVVISSSYSAFFHQKNGGRLLSLVII